MNEVYDLLKPWCDDEFWDFGQHEIVPNSIYVFGRKQFVENLPRIRDMMASPDFVVVFGNSAEGSGTLTAQLDALRLRQEALDHKLLLISGGDLEPGYNYLLHEHFLTRVFDYEENLQAADHCDAIFRQREKPYKFLFLNGRARPHRKYLLERLRLQGHLDHSLWTMLDGRGSGTRTFSLIHDGVDLMTQNTPITMLPDQYEVSRYRGRRPISDHPHHFAKYELFDNEWGDIYINPAPYTDTYFSLVTETVFDSPHSFRTEKIAKPLAMAHPWICATGPGFYRDLRNLGFQTFDGIIDESFDTIDDPRDRMDRILDIVDHLCSGDMSSFLDACEPICKYNQQHLKHVTFQERASFRQRFFKFITDNDRS